MLSRLTRNFLNFFQMSAGLYRPVARGGSRGSTEPPKFSLIDYFSHTKLGLLTSVRYESPLWPGHRFTVLLVTPSGIRTASKFAGS